MNKCYDHIPDAPEQLVMVAGWLARNGRGAAARAVRNAADKITELTAALAAALAERDAARASLLALKDLDMPTDLVGAVEYMIDHSNKGWSNYCALDKVSRKLAVKVEELAAERDVLREIVDAAIDAHCVTVVSGAKPDGVTCVDFDEHTVRKIKLTRLLNAHRKQFPKPLTPDTEATER